MTVRNHINVTTWTQPAMNPDMPPFKPRFQAFLKIPPTAICCIGGDGTSCCFVEELRRKGVSWLLLAAVSSLLVFSSIRCLESSISTAWTTEEPYLWDECKTHKLAKSSAILRCEMHGRIRIVDTIYYDTPDKGKTCIYIEHVLIAEFCPRALHGGGCKYEGRYLGGQSGGIE